MVLRCITVYKFNLNDIDISLPFYECCAKILNQVNKEV